MSEYDDLTPEEAYEKELNNRRRISHWLKETQEELSFNSTVAPEMVDSHRSRSVHSSSARHIGPTTHNSNRSRSVHSSRHTGHTTPVSHSSSRHHHTLSGADPPPLAGSQNTSGHSSSRRRHRNSDAPSPSSPRSVNDFPSPSSASRSSRSQRRDLTRELSPAETIRSHNHHRDALPPRVRTYSSPETPTPIHEDHNSVFFNPSERQSTRHRSASVHHPLYQQQPPLNIYAPSYPYVPTNGYTPSNAYAPSAYHVPSSYYTSTRDIHRSARSRSAQRPSQPMSPVSVVYPEPAKPTYVSPSTSPAVIPLSAGGYVVVHPQSANYPNTHHSRSTHDERRGRSREIESSSRLPFFKRLMNGFSTEGSSRREKSTKSRTRRSRHDSY